MYSYEDLKTIYYEHSNICFRYLVLRKLVRFNQCIRTCKSAYIKDYALNGVLT